MEKKKNISSKRALTSKFPFARVPNMMRDAIKKAMDAKGMNPYRMAKAVKGKVTAPAVYDFLSGKSDMNSRFVDKLLRALELEIRPK